MPLTAIPDDTAPLLPLGRPGAGHRRPWDTPRFWYGACYYPEHWDAATRRHDAERMAAAGINVVRMGEFAWDLFEPAEGRFDFTLYDEVLAELQRHGIAAILGTPTAAPPLWLTRAHPEILRVDAKGVTLAHGSRQHASHFSPVFRHHSRAITAALARHFAGHPAVVGWQTDNEIHCHFSEDHGPAAQEAFRRFLEVRYDGDLAALNHAWGNAFWAQTCTSFAHIETPRDGLPTYQNPGARLDYVRFLADGAARFQHEQVAILRAADARWFVTHNGLFGNIDYRGAFTADLDVLGHDVYPMFCHDPARRPEWLALSLDRARCLSGNFIIPELQAGPGGQPGYLLDTPEPGEMRSFVYESLARGADSLLFFRWRTCRMGAEEYWCGILDHDNVPRRRYTEVAAIGAELARVAPALLGTAVRVEAAVASGDLAVEATSASYRSGLNLGETTRDAHHALLHAGLATGLVHPADDLSTLGLYIIPGWELIDPAWVAPLERWVAAGGVLVIGPRSGTRTLDNRITADTWPGVLRPLAGATVQEFGRLNHPGSRPFTLELAGRSLPAQGWYEQLAPDTDTAVVARWRGRHLDGQPAITRRAHGRGQVFYVGTWLDAALWEVLLPVVLAATSLRPLLPGCPPTVHVSVREDSTRRLWFAINHGEQPATVALPPGLDLVSGRPTTGPLTLERFGVAVVQTAAG
jgi:beta-galactosidase